MEEGSDYYVVRKGDVVAVYKTLSDCQAQISSSVSGPAASAYKGHFWSREKEEYLSSRGISNATYVISATELREDIFGPLVPCSFQEIVGSSSNQPTPNHIGIRNGVSYQAGSQSVDLNQVARSSTSRHISPANFNHSRTVDAQLVSAQLVSGQCEARSSTSRHMPPANIRHSGAVDAQPVSKQCMVGILHFDGASKGNPGKAGAGAVLMTEDDISTS